MYIIYNQLFKNDILTVSKNYYIKKECTIRLHIPLLLVWQIYLPDPLFIHSKN